MKIIDRMWMPVAVAALVVGAWGCAQTFVNPQYEQATTRAGPVLHPGQVFVYDFSVTAAHVSENQGVFAALRNSLSDTTENERELVIAQEVQTRMAEELVAGIRALGLPAQRAPHGAPFPPDAIAVAGLFLNVDEGNRLSRTLVGLGMGQSTVDTKIEVYAPGSRSATKLLEFITHADSGSTPGALVTGGVGAAASGGLTAGMAVMNVGMSGLRGYRSQVEQMTSRSADQAVAYLSQYFAKRGWIPAQKARQAKMEDD